MPTDTDREVTAPINHVARGWFLCLVLLLAAGSHVFGIYARRAHLITHMERALFSLLAGILLSGAILFMTKRLYSTKRIARMLMLGIFLFNLGLVLECFRHVDASVPMFILALLHFVQKNGWITQMPILFGLSIFFISFYLCILEIDMAKTELEQEARVLAEEMEEHQRAEQALRASEEQLRNSLNEKEVLMREIHHRTKNNMQVISSLLRLQERKVHDGKAAKALQESRDRIRAMSLIHETLYRSDDLSHIEVKDYLARLGKGMVRALGTAKARIAFEAEDIYLHIDDAVPLGLVINELVSNAMEHAFAKNSMGVIDVYIHQIGDDKIELTIQDNGVGLPEGAENAEDRTLGLELVHTLVQDQLGGTLHIARENGTKFTIRFTQSMDEG